MVCVGDVSVTGRAMRVESGRVCLEGGSLV